MQGIGFAALGTLFTFGMTALGAALVFFLRRGRAQRAQRACCGFAAGVMMAAAVFSLLLPAVDRVRAAGGSAWLTAAGGFLAGAGVILLADEGIGRKLRGTDEALRRQSLMMAAVTLHNIPEGMAVGLAFAGITAHCGAEFAAAAALALGVGLQNIPEGAAISLPLRKGGMSRMRSFLWGAASGAVEPLFGVMAAGMAAAATPVLPLLMAFSAGAMMLVVVKEMIPEAEGRDGALYVMLGYALMMALDIGLS